MKGVGAGLRSGPSGGMGGGEEEEEEEEEKLSGGGSAAGPQLRVRFVPAAACCAGGLIQSGSWRRERLRPGRKPDPGPPRAGSRCTDVHVNTAGLNASNISPEMGVDLARGWPPTARAKQESRCRLRSAVCCSQWHSSFSLSYPIGIRHHLPQPIVPRTARDSTHSTP
jgi:hypothetical protein